MASSASKLTPISDEIVDISLYNLRPIYLHGYVAPFILIYAAWLYVWTVVFGVDEYYEAGFIALAIVGILQILTCLFCHWFVSVRCLMTCNTCSDPFHAGLAKVVPSPNNGYTELVPLFQATDLTTGKRQIWFIFQKMKYSYDSEEKKQFLPVDFPAEWSFKEYMEWKGYAEENDLRNAETKYGKNIMKLDIPQFLELFKERATAPFFVFQVFCVGLWCLDEYWYYSVFTLFMLVTFEATLVQQQLRNMTEIRKMGNRPYQIMTYRNRKWRTVMSDELVPGDLVSIGRSQDEKLVPCDMLLLRGPCIVDEAMLTGESVPVMKEPIENQDMSTILNAQNHGKLHFLFGGTKVVQHSPPSKTGPGLKSTDNGCIAFVVRNSFSTSQGKLLRTILFGVKRVTANNLETFLFILFLLIFAIIAASYVWVEGSKDPNRNKYKLFLECTLILTSVVPPELPIELSLAVNTSLLALSKLHVFCVEPFRIPFAGKVDFCCFDKTGTLTSDNLVVEGVAGLSDNGELVSPGLVPEETAQVLATCHALVQLDTDLVGDPLEKATLQAVDWTLSKGDTVVPRKGKGHGLKIYQRFHFASSLKRMSVIVGHTPVGSVETTYMATVKGAPETLKPMFSSVPAYYDSVYLEMARRGARVLALGHRKLGNMSHQQVRDLKRDKVECDLHFDGFVIISCPLKLDSKDVIREIQHASHNVMMITGDNPLTACHVAKELRISKKPHTLVLTSPKVDMKQWHWRSIDDSVCIEMNDRLDITQLYKEHDLCMTGEGLSYLETKAKQLIKVLVRIRIFARMSPKEKESIITTLKAHGYITLMCGDGTNDVGALKHAHVGVALLANAPEVLPERRRPREIDIPNPAADRQPPALPSSSRGGKSTSRAAKRQAVARGDNLAPTQKKLAQMLKDLEEEDKSQVVRLGDASIASPFTSKLSTPMCVCHIIKQGRCTLVTTLQMFKILALNALVLAYSQSVLYLEGVKFSDSQATMQGLLLAGCFLFISRSKPLKVLSKSRPLPNIFNVYTILTVLLQSFVHLASLIYLKMEAETYMPPREGEFVNLEEDFKPTIINTTVYIMSMALQLSTFAVNYKGHPFMEGLTENKPLLYSLMFSGSAIVMLASGVLPDVSNHFELIELESAFRDTVLKVLFVDISTAFCIDRILQFLFGKARSHS